ncbi:MAG: hypothetical protein ACXAB4_01025 [Candidatus Hodarchaeales archaeon]|jgi:hypothetical protein
MATLDQFMKKPNEERALGEYTPALAKHVKHSVLIRLVLLSFLEGGLGNQPKPAALFEEILSTIIRISKNSPLLYSLFGSKDVPRISRSNLQSQLRQMLEKGEVIRYGKGYRLNPTRADSVFLDLEIDPL